MMSKNSFKMFDVAVLNKYFKILNKYCSFHIFNFNKY